MKRLFETIGLVALLVCSTVGCRTADPWPRLIGEWRGRGSFFGAEASADLSWESVLGGRFQRQTHRITMHVSGAERVYESTAYYASSSGDRTTGTWFDNLGSAFTFDAELRDDAIATRWVSAASGVAGRTVYLASGTGLIVLDSVATDVGWREIGRMSYARTSKSP